MKLSRKTGAGFTLVELAMVVVIIGILIASMIKGQSVVQAARTNDAISLAHDMRVAAQAFKQRYHYLPGDFPAESEISNISASCLKGGSNGGDGNGLINATESLCVAEHLIRANLIQGDPTQPFVSRFGALSIISLTNSQTLTARPTAVFSAAILNVIEFANLPCEVATEIDRKLDDGNLATGNIQASVTSCVVGQTNDPVSFLALPL